MTTASSDHAFLADLYRHARELASDESARPEDTAALHEATTALFASDPFAPAAEITNGQTDRRRDIIRERIRRVAIVALRRQALAIRAVWTERSGAPSASGPDELALLQQAVTFGEAALALHKERDATRDITAGVAEYLTSTMAIAQLPPKSEGAPAARKPSPVEAAPPAAAPPSRDVPSGGASSGEAPPAVVIPVPAQGHVEAQVFVVGDPALAVEEVSRPAVAKPAARSRRAALIPALAALAVIGFIAGFALAPRIWQGRAASRTDQRPASPATPAAVVPARTISPLPAATPLSPMAVPAVQQSANADTQARPQPSPLASPAAIGIVLASDPNGAQVFIGGAWQGTTPLRLARPAGTIVKLTVRHGTRVWRGTLRIGERPGEVVTVRLPAAPAPVAQTRARPSPSPAPRPSATPASAAVSPQTYYQGLMTKGVELYRGGWYGPAMARFRAASQVYPNAPSPYLWYARAALRVGRTADARAALERVLAVAPNSPAGREAQALLNRLR